MTGRRWSIVVSVACVLALTALPAGAAPRTHRAFTMPAFYTVPDPLPAGDPGTLIKSEDLGPVTGGERYRIMYHSRSVHGTDIAVTGLLFVPSSPAPAAGRPVLSWAHGTSGAADQCAPSLGGYDPQYLTEWLQAGYVVTATDYEGMGTPGVHPYLFGESEGRGVLDATRVALAFPGASARNDVVVFGHSQGGHAALFANEIAPAYAPDLHLVGTIAAAPASQLIFAYTLVDSGPVIRAAVIMMGTGFAQQYPELDLHAVYTDEAIARMGVVETTCQEGIAAAYADLTGAETVKVQPGDVPRWRDVLLASEPGFRVGASPVLMLQGTADEEVPYLAGQILDARLCATGQVHEMVTYPGETHSGIFDVATDKILRFANDRLNGKPPLDTCPPPPVAVVPAAPVAAAPAFTG